MDRILNLSDLATTGARLRADGRTIVLTNGCFDILHVGHIDVLERSRALGDVLVVAVNADTSVRELKGPTRPINSEIDRATVLAALRCVDHVVIFSEKRAVRVIQALRPHIYAKGGDYTPESLDADERTALQSVGSEIQILPLVPGKSTTATIQKLQPPRP